MTLGNIVDTIEPSNGITGLPMDPVTAELVDDLIGLTFAIGTT